MMRKVIVYKRNSQKEEEKIGEAIFHCFSMDFVESHDGFGNYPAAIIEWPDGRIQITNADQLQFVTPSHSDESLKII